MRKQSVMDLANSFRESRKQCLVTPVEKSVESVDKSRKPFKTGYAESRKRNVSSDRYSSFLKKYEDIENMVDSFTTHDLMYFFREKAREVGVKYVIANMKRDLGIFKKLQTDYEPREICLMIEFIFCSEQNYLDKNITQPTVLSSTWCNTIYRDSILWANDEYDPTVRPVKQKVTREWSGDTTTDKAKVGDWE
ncbi:MAG: hypothetical protein IKB72_00620 [Ruminococcus sp.]|nr:hypothetical protein [Ruminococcus sp.]